MRRSVIACFEEFVVGTASVYTGAQFNESLGMYDMVAIQAVVDQVAGTSPDLTVAIEGSNDQRNWVAKNGTAEISAEPLSSSATNVFVGTDAGSTPSLAFVRLKITLGGTNPSAHVKISVCLRDKA